MNHVPVRGTPAAWLPFVLFSSLAAPSRLHAVETGTLSAEYVGVAHGLAVLKMTADLTLTPNGYSIRVQYHTAGMFGMMVHITSDASAQGSFDGAKPLPTHYGGTGRMRGVDRVTEVDYRDGNPVIRTLTPPVEQERTLVPAADTAHTVDTLSAMAMLIRGVGARSRCDGDLMTFDGRRLTALHAHTVGPETLPVSPRSSFSGPTLRCDFEGRQLAGFVKTEDEDALRKPRLGSAWLAPVVPGAPPVPIRAVFDNKILGQVTMYLISVTGSK